MDRKYATEAAKLERLGVPLLSSVVDRDYLIIEYSPYETFLAVLSCGSTAYVLSIRITNRTGRALAIVEWELAFPWVDPVFQWLVDPREHGSRTYRVPGTAIEYERRLVLNHQVKTRGKVSWRLEGLLLAYGHPSIPEAYRHQPVPLTLNVIDTKGGRHSEVIDAYIDRSAEGLHKKRLQGRRKSLFERASGEQVTRQNSEPKGLIDECIATADAVLKRQRADPTELRSDPLTIDKSP